MRLLYLSIICLVIALVTILVIARLRQRRQLHNSENTVASLKEKIIQAKEKLANFPDKPCVIEYPMYYINMDKNPDRRERMESALSTICAKYKRIKGFNGYKITNTNHDIVDGIEFYNSYPSLTKGEIGCLISHLIAIKTARNNGDNIAIICEDDISFDTCSVIPSLTEIVQNAPKDWEIIQLYSGLQQTPKKTIQYVPRTDQWACSCYLINKKGMSAILSVVQKNDNPNEFHIVPKRKTSKTMVPSRGEADFYLYESAITYVVSPSLFIPDDISNVSTLHTDHASMHIESELKAYNALIKFLEWRK
jgi:GR25 family glycosyltransferase involved in LPS biosynthesis